MSPYALAHLPAHLIAAGRWDDLERLLCDLFYLEAKVQAGRVFDLAGDFTAAVEALPADRPQRRILRLLEEALRRDIHFIARHAQDYPQGLFQCLWNSCWWYDCPEAAQHYVTAGLPVTGRPRADRAASRTCIRARRVSDPAAPADRRSPVPDDDSSSAPTLHALLERWRQQKDEAEPGFPWLRSLRPPPMHLGTAQLAVLRGHEDWVSSVSYSPDGRRIASGSDDKTVRVWDAESGAELAVLRGHEGGVT